MTQNTLIIYHNSRCSKSRSVCELVAARGVEAEVIEYLKTPPSKDALRSLLAKLGMQAADLVRRGESVYQEHFADRELDEEQWLEALVAYPILIERPIIVSGDHAVIGRPPEKVLTLIDALG